MLLILAGVTITLMLGEGGIIDMAKEAAEKTNKAINEEQDDMKSIEETIYNVLDPFKPNTVKEAIKEGRKFAETRKIKDENENEMWVPKDFKVVEGERIDTGVVIEDGIGNQFVWVPVPKINDMVYCYEHPTSTVSYDEGRNKLLCSICGDEKETNFAGKLYATSSDIPNNFDKETTQTGYHAGADEYIGIREPDVLSNNSYDGNSDNLKIVLKDYTEENNETTFKTELQIEFNKMATSVGKYKGFYIGRYETSNLSNEGDKYNEINQGKVVKGALSINNANWYRQYVSNKKIGSSYKNIATTNMIWGCQWDATMQWFLSSEDEIVRKYVNNSLNKGNYYAKTFIPTGTNDDYAVNRIYDMAGNVWECTMETTSTNIRANRGGGFNNSPYNEPAGHSSGILPDVNGDWGSRSALYIE